jgi:acid stress chaperone HdeB
MKNMQRLVAGMAVGLAMIASLTAPALADKVDISAVSCSQLLESIDKGSENDKSGMGGILYWIAGYSNTEEQGSVIDFDALAKDFDKILAGCKAQPKLGLLTVASKNLGENGTEHGAEAIDLATMTCQKAISTPADDEEGLGLILMWIAGYQASYKEGSKIFDTDEFVADMTKIGEYCGSNPTIGLLTASDEIMGEDEADDSK